MQPGSYFPGDELRLAELLDSFLTSLAEDLPRQPFRKQVVALILAGGYGRGEGGIFREKENATAQLYNDLEFYLILRDDDALEPAEKWCASQSHAGDELLGIEVEFKLLHERALQSAEPSMFYYDLLAANRIVFGSNDFAKTLPVRLRDPALIPAHEAARLLFNRGTGLFYSLVALQKNSARVSNGFIERNHAKVRLALADAVLAFNGRYHFSCLERHKRLDEQLRNTPPDWQKIRAWHAAGVEFKLHPRHLLPTPDVLKNEQSVLSEVWMNTFLWLESQRIGRAFSSTFDYAKFRGRLFPTTKPLRNFALHVRDKLKRGAALPAWFDYPRAPLQRALCLLLQPQPEFAKAARHLGLKANANLENLHSAYERWWKFYN